MDAGNPCHWQNPDPKVLMGYLESLKTRRYNEYQVCAPFLWDKAHQGCPQIPYSKADKV
jgi:hypothetical protein